MTNEVEDALKVFEETGSNAALQYAARFVGGYELDNSEGLRMLEEIKKRVEKMYQKSNGNVPPAIEGLMFVINDFTGPYKSPAKVKNLP
jgi:predicted TIM-barrel fold metal-dependent hydrolase